MSPWFTSRLPEGKSSLNDSFTSTQNVIRPRAAPNGAGLAFCGFPPPLAISPPTRMPDNPRAISSCEMLNRSAVVPLMAPVPLFWNGAPAGAPV